jgi:glycogen debranching enzyme
MGCCIRTVARLSSLRLCARLQGYVFDAWNRMAEVFDVLGEQDRAGDLRRKPAELQRKFEKRFWCEEVAFYAFTLDPGKKVVATIASNTGHLLWSGIASRDRAERVMNDFSTRTSGADGE